MNLVVEEDGKEGEEGRRRGGCGDEENLEGDIIIDRFVESVTVLGGGTETRVRPNGNVTRGK